MGSRNCDSHGDPSSQQQHLNCRQCTDGEAKQQRLKNAGVHQTPAAVERNSKRRRRLRFQNKAAEPECEASPSQRTRRAFLRSRTRMDMLVREWGKLGSAIRRAAAVVCLTPLAGTDEEEEHDLPYVHLDKVITCAVSREAFGPLYLVT